MPSLVHANPHSYLELQCISSATKHLSPGYIPLPQSTLTLQTSKMSAPSRRVLQRTLTRLPTTALRHNSSTPYPFTKPSTPGTPSAAPRDTTATAAAKSYPFTKPSDPAPVASPTRPVPRPGPTHDPSYALSNEAEDPLDIPRPDYNVVEADYRVGTFSPTPMRVQDGSENMDVAPAAVTSGAPVDIQARTVR